MKHKQVREVAYLGKYVLKDLYLKEISNERRKEK